jgi:hypothetical protein
MAEYAATYRDIMFGSENSAPAQDKTAAQKPFRSGGGLLFVGDTFTTPTPKMADNDVIYFGGMKIEPDYVLHAVQWAFNGNLEGGSTHHAKFRLIDVEDPTSIIEIHEFEDIESNTSGSVLKMNLTDVSAVFNRAKKSYYLAVQLTDIGGAGVSADCVISAGLWYSQG